MSAIVLSEVSKSFRSIKALQKISLKIPKGEFFGLLGPNGAGKSTLMHLITGYLDPDEGEIFLEGNLVQTNSRSARKALGIVPQDLALYHNLSALQNLEIFAKLYQMPKAIARDRAEALLHSVDLFERRHSKIKTFSGGMKRRLNLIVGLLHEPTILLCDEPTVGVDPQSRNAIFEFLQAQNECGLTVIYTTHYMEEAERLCSRIAIIDGGEIKAIGTKEDLIKETDQRPQLFFPNLSPPADELFQGLGTWSPMQKGSLFQPDSRVPLSRLFAAIESSNIPEDSVQIKQPSMEGVFLALTGRQLRD